jgi:hypothetical protein
MREVLHQNRTRVFGNGPAYLVFLPDGYVYWFLNNAPAPDDKSIYRKLNALNQKGQPKREVYEMATLPTDDSQKFSVRTLDSLRKVKEFAESGDLERMRAELRIVEIAIDCALSANRVLQPVERYLSIPDPRQYFSFPDRERPFSVSPKRNEIGYIRACRQSDVSAKETLSEISSLLQAARKFRIYESRGGTPYRNINLTHGKFCTSVAKLAQKLRRVPFRSEIANETKETLKAIAVKLEAIGAAWIPKRSRGKARVKKVGMKLFFESPYFKR